MQASSLSPHDLLLKLHKLKSPQSKQIKQIKEIDKSIDEYSDKFTSIFSNFANGLREIESKMKQIKSASKVQQRDAFQRLDRFQKSLKGMLEDYAIESRQAHQKLTIIMNHHQQSLKKGYSQFLILDKTSVQRYIDLNAQIQSLLSTVQARQQEAMQEYSRIKIALKRGMTLLLDKNELDLKQIQKQGEDMMRTADQLERRIEEELQKVIHQRKDKRFAISQQMHFILEEITNIAALP